MSYFVGAYACSPNTSGWDPALEEAYFSRLKSLSNVKGLELPFSGNLHPHDDAWLLENIRKDWRFLVTSIPGVMSSLAVNPHFGLASDHALGRQEALQFMAKACNAVAKLNAACGYAAVEAIEIHTAPNRKLAASSVAALKESLATLVQWDWQGARIVIEHCDAFMEGQNPDPAKGFLTLSEEIEAIHATNSRFGSDVGVVINWGRSVIEARRSSGAMEHIELAKQHGVLAGLMFSGASAQNTAYGAWSDSHMPHEKVSPNDFGASGSLMTRSAIHECMQASDAKNLPILGIKIGVRPLDASIDERMGHIVSGLEILDAAS